MACGFVGVDSIHHGPFFRVYFMVVVGDFFDSVCHSVIDFTCQADGNNDEIKVLKFESGNPRKL